MQAVGPAETLSSGPALERVAGYVTPKGNDKKYGPLHADRVASATERIQAAGSAATQLSGYILEFTTYVNSTEGFKCVEAAGLAATQSFGPAFDGS